MKARLTGLLDVALGLAKEALGVTQLQAKLDACSDACELSEDAEPLKPGDPAWSHAYEDVADLRRDWLREVGISNQQSAEMTRLGRELARANNEVGRLSKCAAEHEKKSNDRRLELVAIAQALGCPVVKEKMLERIAELKGDTFKAPALTWSDWAPGTWFSWELNREVNGYRRTADNGYSVTAAGGQWFATGGHKGGCQDNDFAREAADACLVNQGTLEPSRAFVRMGDWRWVSSTHGGEWQRTRGFVAAPMTVYAVNDVERQSMDAALVERGMLDPSRAFEALTGLTVQQVGDWEKAAEGVWIRDSSRLAIRVNDVVSGVPPFGWQVFAVPGVRPVLMAAGQETGDDGKEVVDALLAQHGWLDPSRAFKVRRAEELAPLSDEEIVARHGKHSLAVPFTLENVQDAAEKLRAASAPKYNASGEPDDAGTFYAANQGLPVQGPFVDLGKEGAK